MGNCFEPDIILTEEQIEKKRIEKLTNSFFCFPDKFKNLNQISEALFKCGLETSNLIVSIDYTASNTQTGKKSFNGKCLHQLEIDALNPYEKVIQIIGRTLERFDEDKLIPLFGFGDKITKAKGVFKLMSSKTKNGDCYTFKDVLQVYRKITPSVILSGPTNFAPSIRQAIEIVKQEGDYHILLLLTDGQVISEEDTINSIKEASNYPLSIIVVGIGDGPFDQLEYFDDRIKGRKFDNLQFVHYDTCIRKAKNKNIDPDTQFSCDALMEIPLQFNAIKKLKLFNKVLNNNSKRNFIMKYCYAQQQQQQQPPQQNFNNNNNNNPVPLMNPNYNQFNQINQMYQMNQMNQMNQINHL